MTGTSDYLLRVSVSDLEALQRFIVGFLSRIPGVGNIQSSIALKQVKYKTALPLPIEQSDQRSGGSSKSLHQGKNHAHDR